MLIQVKDRMEVSSAPDASVADVIEDLRRAASSSRLILTGLVLDGEAVTPERERSWASRPASDFHRLEAEMAPPDRVVGEVFDGLEKALEALVGECLRAAGRIRLGEAAGTFIHRLAEDLTCILDGYRQGVDLLLAGGAPPPREAGPAGDALEPVLNEILDALVSKDMVRLSDALEHELCPALSALSALVRAWSRTARAAEAAGGSGRAAGAVM
jgi:hypothetical protein